MMRGTDGMGGDRWCILRTAGPRTLTLAASLSAAGMDAWTPIEIIKRRRPGGRSGKVERPAAMMPTFVFARASHLGELLALRSALSSPHPPFSVFRYGGRVPLIGSAEMERLRVAERRVLPKDQRREFSAGQLVRTSEGGFAGLNGVVEATAGKFTVVCFGGALNVKISTFLLSSDEVRLGERVGDIAA